MTAPKVSDRLTMAAADLASPEIEAILHSSAVKDLALLPDSIPREEIQRASYQRDSRKVVAVDFRVQKSSRHCFPKALYSTTDLDMLPIFHDLVPSLAVVELTFSASSSPERLRRHGSPNLRQHCRSKPPIPNADAYLRPRSGAPRQLDLIAPATSCVASAPTYPRKSKVDEPELEADLDRVVRASHC